MSRSFAMVAVLLAVSSYAEAQAPAPDAAAIIATSRDYIDGFAEGDSVRMRRALHTDLAKRQITGNAGSPQHQTADILTRMAGSRAGRGTQPGARIPSDSIRILDQYKDMAMVRIGVNQWVDYLQLGRFGNEWKIINVAWQLRQ